MKNVIFGLGFLMSVSAFAYNDGTYNCKNAFKDLPDNTYRINTVNVAGESVPFLEVHRYFRQGENGVRETTIKGFAAVSKSSDEREFMSIGQMTLQFDKGELFGCKK
ncbi:MAG: hypothetical protein M9962_07790 [Oligoflexia bacterium]|nr:hypothetical protein [Oligoflexia bacterium]